MSKRNMYLDSVKQWNVAVGCRFDCKYCKKSFQAQMKRQLRNCEQCYDYEPHFHKERLSQKLPSTQGDQFIWVCSACDIFFLKQEWLGKILERIWQELDKQFFMQSKAPIVFERMLHAIEYDFPPNIWLGVTLETNRDVGYSNISRAPVPSVRFEQAKRVKIDIVIVEPVLEFDEDILIKWIQRLAPRRVYIGYDSKNCRLPEPSLTETIRLVAKLHQFTSVKWKLMRESWSIKMRGIKTLEDYFK